MNIVAEVVVIVFAIFLFAVTIVVFAKPATAERFFNAFASSARAHYFEQSIRLLVGAALVVASPLMWQSRLFWFAGWTIVVSSLALIVTPWRWHFRFGEKIRPGLIQHMKLYALAVFAFAVLLLYGIAAGPTTVGENSSTCVSETGTFKRDTLPVCGITAMSPVRHQLLILVS